MICVHLLRVSPAPLIYLLRQAFSGHICLQLGHLCFPSGSGLLLQPSSSLCTISFFLGCHRCRSVSWNERLFIYSTNNRKSQTWQINFSTDTLASVDICYTHSCHIKGPMVGRKHPFCLYKIFSFRRHSKHLSLEQNIYLTRRVNERMNRSLFDVFCRHKTHQTYTEIPSFWTHFLQRIFSEPKMPAMRSGVKYASQIRCVNISLQAQSALGMVSK